MRAWIGHDIVDLAEPGVAGKEQDRRFMDRVFTPDERARILASAAPTIALWKTWAAKEAAYKIASKLRERVVFAHRAFEVEPGTANSLGHWAQVRFDGLDIRVSWETAREYIHCVGQLIQQSAAHPHAAPRAPRRLFERWELQGAEVLRQWREWGWSPPVIALEGQPLAGFDVSLSHDGRFVAASVVGPG